MILNHGANSLSTDGGGLPPHCLLLDYFLDGYRFGNTDSVTPSSIIKVTDTDTYNLSYFNHSRFSDGFPVGVFDYPQGTSAFDYTVNDAAISGEFTFEYLMRYNANDSGLTRTVGVNYYPVSGTGWIRVDASGSSQIGLRRFNGSSGTWGTIGSFPNSYIDGGRQWNCWHHIAVCVVSSTARIFVDGTLMCTETVSSAYGDVAPQLLAYVMNSNGSNKHGKYMITQIAVWDYAKWDSNFIVDKTLILDM